MEPCVLIASACESITPNKIVQGILEKDELPEPLTIIEGVSSYPWHIDTKYYEADVHICAMNQKTIGNQAFADTVNAVILCFDSLSESKLEPVEQWLSFTKEFEAEIKILVCDSCRSEDFDHSPSHHRKKTVGVSKLEAQRWCVGNGFELVELNPDQSEVDSDVEDDFPESLGIKRVIQALQAHLWPKLRLKDSHRSMLPPQAGLHLQGLVNGLSSSLVDSDSNNMDNNSIEIPVHRDDSNSKGEKEIKVARVKPMPKSEINNDEKDETFVQGDQSLTQNKSEPQTLPILSSASTTNNPNTATATTIKTETVSSSSSSSKIREVVAVQPFQIENTTETSTSSSKSSQPSSTTTTTTTTSEASSSPVTKQQEEQKEKAPSSNLPPKSERIDSMFEAIDSMSDDTFEELFLNLNAMKSKASNLSPTQRKAYAEKMAIAFWKSLGGNDAEVELTSSDEEGA